MSDNMIVISLPNVLCFYQQAAGEIVGRLAQIAENLHKTNTNQTTGVLLLQSGVAQDAVSPWISELGNDCLFNDLVQRIDAWRWLLSLIRNSPVPWTYAAAANCYGSAWELALSCHHRYWFNSRSLLGFPEIEAGVFPPGGLLESMSKRAGRTRERWQATPVCAAKVALSDGLIDYCSDASNWHDQARRIFSELIAVQPTAGVRPMRRTRPRHDFVSVDAQSRRAAYKQIESVSSQEKFGKASGPTAWDYCWQLVSERAKLRQPADLGRIISLIATRYLLLPQYSNWLEKQLITAPRAAITLVSEALIASPPVAINLTLGIPPSSVLSKLLENQQQVLLVANDARELIPGLNLLFARIERALGIVAAQHLWERGVTWCQGQPTGFSGPVLAWTADDFFSVSEAQVEYRFFRLSGNHIESIPGVLEFSQEPAILPRTIKNILTHVSDAVVRNPDMSRSITPLSMQFRSLFLDELIRTTSFCDHDLAAAVGSLQRSGWEFAGSEDNWERFLKIRNIINPNRDGSTLNSNMPRFDFEYTSWRQAKQLAKRLPSRNLRNWNHVSLSQHMATYLGILTRLTETTSGVEFGPTLDFLAGVSLGIPQGIGSPMTFLRLRGSRRTDHYARNHWQHLFHSERT